MHLGKNYILKILSPSHEFSSPSHCIRKYMKNLTNLIYTFIYKVTKLYIKFTHIDKLRANYIWQYNCSRNHLVLA